MTSAVPLGGGESERASIQLVREWEATFDAFQNGVAVLDASGRIVRVNSAFRRLLGLRAARAVAGVALSDLLAEQAGEGGREAAAAARAGSGGTRFQRGGLFLELRLQSIGGTRPVAVGSVALVVDVTAERLLERERRKLRRREEEANRLRAEADRLAELEQMKTNLLNLVSHELRTPITVVSGYLDMLRAEELGPLPEAARGTVELLRQQIGEMNLLVEEILEVTRLHERRLVLDRARVDAVDLVLSAVEVARIAFGTERLRVERAERELPVLADRDRLQAVLVSLIGNALKFSDGEVTIAVDMHGETVGIRITDHGIGIAASDQEAIFRRLGRLVTTENAHLPGTGLGLYMAREIARLHGGNIRVESAPGAGSTFTVELPLEAD